MKNDFMSLINTRFERTKIDEEQVKKALSLIKEKLDLMRSNAYEVLKSYDREGTKHLTLRNFKVGINSLRVLSDF